MIRVATTDDAGACVRLLLDSHENFKWKVPAVSVRKTMGRFVDVLKENRSAVLEEDGEIVGAALVYEGALYFSTEPVLFELFTYVKKGHNGLDLIRFVKELAKVRKIMLLAGQASGTEVERTQQMYSRMGFTLIGFSSVYLPEGENNA